MKYLPVFIATYFLIACQEDGNIAQSISGDWNIPSNQVFDGGPGKDGIPALTTPNMVNANQATYLSDDDLVVGYKRGNDVRAYPHPILDWHEIVNDVVDNHPVALIYCPLTGTATGWERTINGNVTTFGVSGLLYNTNVIPYDRATDSNWSQMRLECVNGTLRNTKPENIHMVETTWATWKAMYPDTKVISSQTGFNRNYGFYPYGSYKTNNGLFLFPYTPQDNRLPTKERVLGVVINNEARVYRFEHFQDSTTVVHDVFNKKELVVLGSESLNYLVAFERKLSDGTTLNFSAPPTNPDKSIVLTDNEENLWNVFGEAVSGPRAGQKLVPVVSFIGYWFSWGAFYPNAVIYEP